MVRLTLYFISIFVLQNLYGFGQHKEGKYIKLQNANLTTKLYREKFTNTTLSNNTIKERKGKPLQVNSSTQYIGTTTYDYQTNASMPRRIFEYDNYNITASWNGSQQLSGFKDRGTFVNSFDGISWGSNPTTRIENDSTGWGNLIVNNSKEILVAEPNILSANSGFGTQWNTSNNFTNKTNLFAPHSAISGNNIHVIMSSIEPDSSTGFVAPIYYTRSLDGGLTFDSIRADFASLAGYDTSNHAGDLGPNAYSIDANGSTVAILALGVTEDVVLLKSIDNGNTWTRTIIREFPIKKYRGGKTDHNGDGVTDTVLGVTGDGSIIIDDSGRVHVVFSDLEMFADDTGGMNIFITSKSDYFNYWNDYTKKFIEVPTLTDINGDGIFNSGSHFLGNGNLRYGNSGYSFNPIITLSEHPSFQTHIFIAYVAVKEMDTLDNGADFRGIYTNFIETSSLYISEPYYNSYTQGAENVYLSIPRTIKFTNYHLCYTKGIWQQDFDPGNSVQGMHNNSVSDLAFDNIYFYFYGSVGSRKNNNIQLNVFPNPSSSNFNFEIYSKNSEEVDLSITNTLGQTILTRKIKLNSQENKFNINLLDCQAGLYTATIISKEGIVSEKIMIK